MRELKEIVAEKLVYLRKESKLTQAELAEKLNYSDKSVSKWERAESLPDLEVLVKISELYNVSLDYLVFNDTKIKPLTKSQRHNRLIISSLAVLTVWVIATLAFILCQMTTGYAFWMMYVWAIPLSCIVGIVFNVIWGRRWLTFVLCGALACTLIIAVYVQFLSYNLWQVFILAVPAIVVTVLCSRLKKTPKKNKQASAQDSASASNDKK